MPDLSKLSERQRRMYHMIQEFIRENSYPPTVREIGEAVGISSTSVVMYNLKELERKGFITRERDVSRSIRLVEPEEERANREEQLVINIPFLGTIAAGEPIPVPDPDLADAGDYVSVPVDLVPARSAAAGELYALRVKGDSMIDAYIDDGDIVIVRRQPTANNGDTVVAWLKEEKETTLKSFYLEPDRRRIRLQPRNPALAPIYCDPANVEIQGKVVGVIRRFD
ncbi:MAG: transcriptional repressor LexA [Chloroflexi bacterium]|nr:transcriptional repressor LexA [Chloroflexota bacterium]